MPQMFARFLLAWFGCAVIIFYVAVREKNFLVYLARLNRKVGCLSLEIYIAHVLLIQIIKAYDLWGFISEPLWYVVIPAVSYFTAALFSWFAGKIIIAVEEKK